MKSKSKKNKGFSGQLCIGEIERDRLSELPDDILVHILSFLPIRDAVETMLLKRFGNLWTLVSNLSIGYCHSEQTTVPFSQFWPFVHHALILHKKPTIDKFYLHIGLHGWEMEEYVTTMTALDVCIIFALTREAKALILTGFLYDPRLITAPIFDSQSLVRLELEYCIIELPCRVHMESLRTLKFESVMGKGGNLNDFLSGCPRLQVLVLIETECFYGLGLSSPSIEKLVINHNKPTSQYTIDCPNLKSLDLFVYLNAVEVINVSSICELTINDSYHRDVDIHEGAHLFKRFLEGFQNVEFLTLTHDAVLHLTYCLMANVGFPQNRWKCVVLTSPIEDTNIAGICSLVKNSPSLEELIIHVQPAAMRRCLSRDIGVVSQEALLPCVALHLKLIALHGCVKPYDCELQLVEFLLKSAVNLDELVITNWRPFKWPKQLTSALEQKFVRQLSEFSRSSRKARILFQLDYNN